MRGPLGRPRTRSDAVAADKAYSSRADRARLRKRGIKAVIPEKADQAAHRKKRGRAGGRPVSHDAELYKQRNTVERCINKIKVWRGLAMRSDKTPESYLAGLSVEELVPLLDERRRRRSRKPQLDPLLRVGLLQPGQRLTWDRPRLGEQHIVAVDALGNLITGRGRICATPDVATKAITGYPAAGWPAFRTDDGVSLQLLRERLAPGSSS